MKGKKSNNKVFYPSKLKKNSVYYTKKKIQWKPSSTN